MEFINQFITITKIQRKDSKRYTDTNTVTGGNWDFLWIDKIGFYCMNNKSLECMDRGSTTKNWHQERLI